MILHTVSSKIVILLALSEDSTIFKFNQICTCKYHYLYYIISITI
jgi:hypothetical protein